MFCLLVILFYVINTFHCSINNCQLFDKNLKEKFATGNNKNLDMLLSTHNAFL